MSTVHNWPRKFAIACSGVLHSVRNQNSFWIHLPIALAVLALSAWLGVEPWRWVAVVVAITIVLSIELMNTALENLVAVLHPEHDERVGRALDAGAGAVLIAALGAAMIGIIALGMPLWEMLRGQ